MKRIIIIGPSGSGKSTLAKQLSELLHLPHTELDGIYHQAGWQELDREEFAKRVHSIADGGEWILCGNYFTKLGMKFWHKSDTIIWCDYPFPVVASRLLRRTIRRTATKEELWNGNRETFYVNFATKKSILVWMLKSWKRQKKRYGAIFDHPKTLPNIQLIRLRNENDKERFLEKLRSGR